MQEEYASAKLFNVQMHASIRPPWLAKSGVSYRELLDRYPILVPRGHAVDSHKSEAGYVHISADTIANVSTTSYITILSHYYR
jgi:hypothetical protein